MITRKEAGENSSGEQEATPVPGKKTTGSVLGRIPAVVHGGLGGDGRSFIGIFPFMKSEVGSFLRIERAKSE